MIGRVQDGMKRNPYMAMAQTAESAFAGELLVSRHHSASLQFHLLTNPSPRFLNHPLRI